MRVHARVTGCKVIVLNAQHFCPFRKDSFCEVCPPEKDSGKSGHKACPYVGKSLSLWEGVTVRARGARNEK
jgi:hypothetical protein